MEVVVIHLSTHNGILKFSLKNGGWNICEIPIPDSNIWYNIIARYSRNNDYISITIDSLTSTLYGIGDYNLTNYNHLPFLGRPFPFNSSNISFKGSIDNLVIWDRIINENEIDSESLPHVITHISSASDCKGFWDFNSILTLLIIILLITMELLIM